MGKKSASTGKSKSGERTKQLGKDGGKGEHPKNWPPPKPGEKTVAKFKEFTYYGCGKETGGTCQKWRAHKPKECRGGAPPNSEAHATKRTAGSENKDNKKGIAKKLKIAKPYVAKMEQKVAEHDASDDKSD